MILTIGRFYDFLRLSH